MYHNVLYYLKSGIDLTKFVFCIFNLKRSSIPVAVLVFANTEH